MNRNEYEKKQRDKLTDRIVKRLIYCASRGKIKSDQITHGMIIEKRAAILEWRNRKAHPQPKPKKPVRYCRICGIKITIGVYCSDECRKAKVRQYNHDINKSKKVLKVRCCKECGAIFTPEYGNKKRTFCSDECLSRHANRSSKHIRRERLKVAFRERVYRAEICKRDGFKCQICKTKVNMKANVPHPLAPTMDHIIALANGGTHEASNVRLAHFMCNSLRGDRCSDGGDQLLLFG